MSTILIVEARFYPHLNDMMELPKYQMPLLKDVAIGLYQRALIFLKRAGTIILGTTVLLWALASFPQAKPGQSQVEASIAGKIATGIEVVVKPIGFNHDISLALLPAMAAREVAVSAIATVYSIDASDEEAAAKPLADRLHGRWSLATALAFLAWFVFAPQCISTIAVTRRETNGWKWPLFMSLRNLVRGCQMRSSSHRTRTSCWSVCLLPLHRMDRSAS